jgi:phosphotriesterase-related protein
MQKRWQTDYLSNKNPANARQTDPDTAIEELRMFAADGGALLVDQSVIGLGRDPMGQKRAAEASGVRVVAATGTYTAPYLSAEIKAMSTSALADLFVSEVSHGIEDTGICAGLIGEIGCSWPLEPVEHCALLAAAEAQQRTGAAISVHPGRHPDACAQILDIIEAGGGDLSRTVLCHMDRTHPDGKGIIPLVERGAVVEWDFFGIEQSHYWMGDVELPTDLGRLRLIKELSHRGYGHQIIISQDICTCTRMTTWGGHGYGHILRNVLPLMDRLSMAPELFNALVRGTPLRLLTLKETTQ